MPRPAFELAGIFRQYGKAYRQAHALPRDQLRVMRAIEVCRTAALGGHVESCGHCDYTRIAYNSCRNRHCPKCQNRERAQWLEARQQELLPVEYFHVVFTLPAEVARLALGNKEVVYSILFRSVAEALLSIARDEKHLGAVIGFFAILHTWGQNLEHHPHVHCVIPGGGLSPDGQNWVRCRPGFFLPVRVLSRRFRRLFLEALEKAFTANQLCFFGSLSSLAEPAAFACWLASLRHREWVVYAKPPFGGARQAVEYLGRYTHRTALSNDRILQVSSGQFNQGQVTFQWKDYRCRDRYKSRTMTVSAEEFIRRFLLHVLPPGFRRIRYFGFLGSRYRRSSLELCRDLLSNPIRQLLPCPVGEPSCKTPARCPRCGTGTLIRSVWFPAYRWPNVPPDSS